MTQRWTFYDTIVLDTYQVEYNPNTMSSPHARQQTQAIANRFGTGRALRTPQEPAQWTFGGFIKTEQSLLDLAAWAQRGNLMNLTDHLNRVWEVRFVQFDEQEQIPSKQSEWKFLYQISALVYRRLS